MIIHVVKTLMVMFVTVMFGLTAAEATTMDMRVYSYISPPTSTLIRKAGLSDKAIENYVVDGLRKRSIKPIDENRVYEDSEDALRVDLRKATKGLVINLSVRQGVSVHNMLQRWEGTRTLSLNRSTPPKKLYSDIINAVSTLLDELKSEYNSDAYKKGSMMEE